MGLSHPSYIPSHHPISFHCIPYQHISPYLNQLYPSHPSPLYLFHPTSCHLILFYPIPSHPCHPISTHPTFPTYLTPSYLILPYSLVSIPSYATPCLPLLLLTSHSAVRWCGRGSAGRCPCGGCTPRRAHCTGTAGRQGSPSGRAGTGHTAGPWRQAGTGTARSPCHTAGTPSPLGSRCRLQGGTTQVRHVDAGTQGWTDKQTGRGPAPRTCSLRGLWQIRAHVDTQVHKNMGGQTDG